MNKLTDFTDWLQTLSEDDETAMYFADSVVLGRQDSGVEAARIALGFTPKQLNTFFKNASAL